VQAKTRLRGASLWLLFLPCAWVLIEWLRGWLFSGFPWLSLGYAFTDSWLAGYAPVAGVYGISLAAAMLAGAGVALVRGNFATRVLAVLLAAAVLGGGLLLSRVSWVAPLDRELRVALVQGAVPQDRKWLLEQLEPTKDLYRDLSLPYLDYDLIVWPEAAIPSMVDAEYEYLEQMRTEAGERGAAIMLGMLEYEPDSGSYFNSLLVLGEPPSIYRKRHLVPFGEYFPVPEFVREWMRLMSLPYVDISKGSSRPEPLEVAGLYAAASICYEDAFGNEQRVFLPQANLLVNVSNDAWFGDSIAPHQHLQIARMRAIEAGRFMLRATNTGVSAVIAPDGRLLGVSPQFETDVLTASIRPYTGATPYVLIGDSWLLLVALAALAVSFAARRHGSV
jgi:apolipoprotein N-acyltransferase